MNENQSHNFMLDLNSSEKKHILKSIRLGCYSILIAAVSTISISCVLLYNKFTEKNEIEFVCINKIEWMKTKYLMFPSVQITSSEPPIFVKCSENSSNTLRK